MNAKRVTVLIYDEISSTYNLLKNPKKKDIDKMLSNYYPIPMHRKNIKNIFEQHIRIKGSRKIHDIIK